MSEGLFSIIFTAELGDVQLSWIGDKFPHITATAQHFYFMNNFMQYCSFKKPYRQSIISAFSARLLLTQSISACFIISFDVKYWGSEYANLSELGYRTN